MIDLAQRKTLIVILESVMKLLQQVLLVLSGLSTADLYANRVLATSPIAYWRLDEESGSTITDSSGNSRNGTYNSVTLAQDSPPMGGLAPQWTPSTSYGQLTSSSLTNAFDMDEGSCLIWVKVENAGVWTDATFRNIFSFNFNADNRVTLGRFTTDNQLIALREGSNVQDFVFYTSTGQTDFFSALLSWSVVNDEFKLYINGAQVGATATGLIAHTPTATLNALLGAVSTTPSEVWDGFLSHCVVWDSPVDADKLALMTV